MVNSNVLVCISGELTNPESDMYQGVSLTCAEHIGHMYQGVSLTGAEPFACMYQGVPLTQFLSDQSWLTYLLHLESKFKVVLLSLDFGHHVHACSKVENSMHHLRMASESALVEAVGVVTKMASLC